MAPSQEFEDIRVLILEDNSADAELLVFHLREAGFVFTSKLVEMKTAYINALRDFYPDIILSDYDLPAFSGAEALRIREELCPETPFILVTGAVGEERAIEMLTGGANDYVLKKNLSRLLPAVRRALYEAYEHRKRKEAESERDSLLKDLERRVQERTEALQIEISERKSAEEAMRKSEERFRAFVRATSDVIYRTNPNWKEIYFLRGRKFILDSATTGSAWLEKYVYPDDIQRVKEAIQQAIRKKSIYELEHRNYRVDGTLGWALSRAVPILNAKGKIIEWFGTARDITKRKQAEKAILDIQKRYRLIVDNVQDSISLLDLDLNYLYLSPSEVRLSGYEPEELMKIPVKDQVTPGSYRMLERIFAEEIVREFGGEPVDLNRSRIVEVEIYHKKGGTVWVEVKMAFTRDENGKPIGILLITRDITERRSIQEALKESERSFRAFVIASSDLVFNITPNWSELNFLQGRQFVPENPISLKEFIYPDDYRQVLEALKEAIRSKSICELEHRVVRADGALGWMLFRAVPILNADGKVIEWFGTARDITKRKQTEEALLDIQKRYRLIVDNIQDSISLLDLNLNIVYIPSAVRISGHDPEELMKIPARERVTPESFRMLKKIFIEEMEREYSGEPVDPNRSRIAEIEVYHKRGGTIWVELKLAFTRDANGKPSGILMTARDITERRSYREALIKSEKRFREMADTMPQLVWTSTPDGRTEYINSRYVDFSGISRSPDGFWDWTPCVHPEDLPAGCGKWKRALEANSDNLLEEHRLKNSNGIYRWYLSRSVAIRDEQGKIIKWVGTATDIHDLKEAEANLKARTKQLEGANKQLESFSYSVSHDLQAPLRAIEGFSRMLLKDEQDLDPETNRKLQVIRENALKMDRLIKDLLRFSRSGQTPISTRKINMDELVSEIWKEQLASNPARNIELIKGNLPKAFGDKALIRQVLSNLLSNAVKFTRKRKKGIIELGGEALGNEAVFYVKDNGTGFDMRFYDKLFGVFQRLHPQSEYEGTGVGLAIVQRIIHRHQGRVWAQGKSAKGATFYFSLPV